MTSIGMAWRMGRAQRPAVRRGPSLVERAVVLAGRKLPTLKRFGSAAMQTAGLGMIDWALFEWALIPGLIGVGVSLLVLEALGSDGRRR